MEIILAKHLSFCGGVHRAVQILFQLSQDRKEPIYVFGELIHNTQFNDSLAAKNIFIAQTLDECKNKLVIIRTHGLPPDIEKKLYSIAREVIDLTCPKVKRIQQLIHDYCQKGFQIIITGNSLHPEVIGLKGYSKDVLIVPDLDSAAQIAHVISHKAILLSQTTFNEQKFHKISQILKKARPELVIENTLCQATRQRQDEIKTLAQKADKVVVIGGKHSSNTLKLSEIASNYCSNVYQIETAQELHQISFLPSDRIALTSGASTPDWIIADAIASLNKLNEVF